MGEVTRMNGERRLSARLFAHPFAIIAVISVVIGGSPNPRADDGPAASLPPSALITPALAKQHGICTLTPDIHPVDRSKTRYWVVLRSFESGISSGTITMYAGNDRYDIPFHDLTTRGIGDKALHVMPLIVRFPNATNVDGAWVSSLSGPDEIQCRAPYTPWSTHGSDDFAFLVGPSDSILRWQAAMGRLTPTDAPPPSRTAPACTVADQPPETLAAVEPEYPEPAPPKEVDVSILVLIDEQNAILNAMVDTSSGYPKLDAAALDAARKTTFRTATFHCQNIVAIYKFVVTFAR